MRMSAYAGVAIVPTLARIVLAAAFMTAGYAKLFTQSEFSASEAATLKSLGASVQLKNAPVTTASANVVFASYSAPQNAGDPQDKGALQEEPQEEQEIPPPPADPETDPADPDAGDESLTGTLEDVGEEMKRQAEELGDRVEETIETAREEINTGQQPLEPLPPGTYEAKSLHHITLMVHNAGWSYPTVLAWVAAVTEFLGGCLLLVGFLSRVWGLGLAVSMAVAFYLSGAEPYFTTGVFTVAQTDIPLFNRVFAQLGLFVLAFGIFLTGPGPLSIDHILFGRKVRSHTTRVREVDVDEPDV